jgi:hypothetical protein
MADSEYILKLVAQLEDQTKGVFDQIAQHGKVAGGDVGKSLDSVRKAVDELEKKLANLKKALATGTGNTQNVQEQIGWFEKLKNNATALQNELQKLPFGMGSFLTSAIGGASAVLSLKYAFDRLHETISEGLMLYSKAALSQEQLATVWRNMGHNMPIAQLKGYMAELSKATTFAPGEIAQAARTLAIHNPITDELMPRALKVATDLAAFRNMDIGSAAHTLGRASEGQFFGLQRSFGVQISATTKESKKFDDVLKDIERSLGGQAALAAGTYHGQLQKIEHQYKAIQKALGGVIEPAAKVWTGAKLEGLENINELAKKSLEGGALKDLQHSLENIALALTALQGAASGKEFDNFITATTEGVGASVPLLSQFLKLLERLGQLRREATEDEGEGAGKEEAPVSLTSNQSEAIQLAHEAVIEHAALIQELNEMPEDFFPEGTLDGLKDGEAILVHFALIVADMQKNLNNIDFGKLKPDVDWKEEGKKAQAYFDRIKGFAEVSYQSQKSLVWATADSKEDAENKIAKLDNEYSLRKIQNAQAEHDAIIALKEQEFKKEEDRVKSIHRVDATDPDIRKNQQKDLDAALKKLNEERTTFSIEQEKKLSEAIQNEIKSRQDAYVKEQQKQIELQQKMRDAALETQKALTDVALAGANEWTKLTAKFREANDTLKRAIEELPKSPERAADLAKQAQSAFAALKQDVAALEKSLRDTTSHFDNLATQIRQATMQPLEKRADEMAELDRMIVKARQLVQAGNLQEAEAIYKEAGSKAAGLATPVEGQSKYAAQDDAARYFGVIRTEAEALAKARVEQGKAANEQLYGKIQTADDVQQQALADQLKTTNEHLADLTKAVIDLTNRLNATKEIKPSEAAQSKAGANIPESGQGASNAPGTFNELAPGVANNPDYQPMVSTAGRGTGAVGGQQGGFQERRQVSGAAELSAQRKSYELTAEEKEAMAWGAPTTPIHYNEKGQGRAGRSQYYMNGAAIEDNGEIARLQESARQKKSEQVRREQRDVYRKRMEQAGFGKAVEGMTDKELDEVNNTSRLQLNYERGTGTYDKSLGETRSSKWGDAFGGLLSKDTNQPFYNAVASAMQPPPSADGASGESRQQWNDIGTTLKEGAQNLLDATKAAQEKKDQKEQTINVKVLVDKDGRSTTDIAYA